MQNELKEEIVHLCRRQARLEEAKVCRRKHIVSKLSKRTGKKFETVDPRKSYVHAHYSPAYCARNADFLARSIWYAIQNNEYEPLSALCHRIIKPDGDYREVMEFSIPDSALSNVVLKKVTTRNLKRFSANSYAYRRDQNIFDAILALKSFMQNERIYAIRIDFAKYFDSISTGFLSRLVSNQDIISTTRHERFIIKQFLYHKYAVRDDYVGGQHKKRTKGAPQGLSLSGLLANLGCHELDLALERKAGRFVRYADDIVALCSRFSEAEEVEEAIQNHCLRTGISINEVKSSRIAVIRKDLSDRKMPYAQYTDFLERRIRQHSSHKRSDVFQNSVEILAQRGFDYLGYRFSTNGLGIPVLKQRKIIRDFSRIIHLQLIQYIRDNKGFNPHRCSTSPLRYDWDILGMIGSLRAYLYGGLVEEDVRDFIQTGKKLPKMKGLMGFYALIDSEDELRYLDKRLQSTVLKTIVERNRILRSDYQCEGLRPTIQDLIDGTWMDKAAWVQFGPLQNNEIIDLRLPSFLRGWRAARKHYFTYGLAEVQPPSYQYNLDTSSVS